MIIITIYLALIWSIKTQNSNGNSESSNNDMILNLKNTGLINLNRIEIYKTNLTKLILSHNRISNIDLLSQFTKLKYLDLSNNKGIKNYNSLANLFQLDYLDLSSNKLNNLYSLQYLTSLTTLRINENQITDIDCLVNLKYLNHLDLSSNIINKLDDYLIDNFHNLNSLYLSKNNLNNIKINLYHPNLKQIRLDDNQFSDLSKIEIPFGLEEINLSYNKIRIFNLNGNYSKLFRLSLKFNQIEYFQESINFVNLKYLELISNRLKNIDFLAKQNFYNLERIDLDDNEIEDVEALSNLSNIKTIYLNDNKIQNANALKKNTLLSLLEITENNLDDICWIKSLIYLDSLSSSNNKIKSLECFSFESDYIWNNLIYLNLSNNEISDISSLKNFTNLTILYLFDNKIEDIFSLSDMSRLRILSLNSNRIKIIEPVKNLKMLKLLNMNDNKIEDISSVKNLTGLWSLEMSRNKISYLPNGLFNNFKSLSRLDLSFNLIKEIDSFGPYLTKNLKTIYLNNNQLKKIPYFANYTNLGELILNNNNIDFIDVFNFSMNQLRTIDISFNSINSNNIIHIDINIGNDLKIVYIDLDTIDLLVNLNNYRINRENLYFKFYKSLYIIIKSDLNLVDCQLQLKYLKNKIHVNLFYLFQVQNFLSSCKTFEFMF
jgi:Leucine-rich repeat (LRR) protein